MRQLIADNNAVALFKKNPTIHFYPENDECPTCCCKLNVQKTRSKTVVTLDIGGFQAKETVLYCPQDQTIFFSEKLRQLAPEKCTFGFDVIVEVGQALFIHCRNNQEVMKQLASKNVFVSEREISYLGRKFIIYLALAHRESQPRLRNLMAQRGGYILHVDGTCEGDSPNLFCGLDGISELILDTIKIASEKKDKLIPFFQRIKKNYGEPRALVHDMGRGIVSAVEEVFSGIPDFICHFHFLRDIGKDLMQDEYTALAKRMQKLKIRPMLKQRVKYIENKISSESQTIDDIVNSIEFGQLQSSCLEHIPLMTTYTIIQWVLEYPRQSGGYGFPFDRPHLDFYRRLQKAHQLLDEIMAGPLSSQIKDTKLFFKVYDKFTSAVEDKRLNALAGSLERKAEVFDKLRTAMRIALPENNKGLNDNGEDGDVKSIEDKVTEFRKWVTGDGRRKSKYAKMIEQMDKYWDKLFADPLPVATDDGIVYIQPQRTNNILEQFFRGEKQRCRKKNGMASLNRVLKAALADTPLVQNLKNSEYMDIILNDCSSLAERFSKIDANLVQKELENEKSRKERILPGVKKLIRDSDLIAKITALFSSNAK